MLPIRHRNGTRESQGWNFPDVTKRQVDDLRTEMNQSAEMAAL
jgi:hypothetical protein